LQLTTHLSTPKGLKAELADLQRTVYPHSGHPLAEGQAQDRVSSRPKTGVLPTVLHNQQMCQALVIRDSSILLYNRHVLT